jgi:voltage-gated sodium channel
MAMAKAGMLIGVLDLICLAIFVVELVLKLLVSRLRFFRDGWNIHDFARGFSGTALAPGG